MNLVVLCGNLVAAPELKYTPKGTAVAHMRLAVNSRYTTAAGEKREKVLFVDVVAWGRQAESCAEYLDKGSKILTQGELESREWTDKTGQKRRQYEINASTVQFLSTNKKTNGAGTHTTPTTVGDPSEHRPGEDDDVPF